MKSKQNSDQLNNCCLSVFYVTYDGSTVADLKILKGGFNLCNRICGTEKIMVSILQCTFSAVANLEDRFLKD